MGTTDFSVTGEPAVSTGMVGAAGNSLCNQIIETARVSLVNSPVFSAC